MIKAIIVDDEQQNRESLQKLLSTYCSDIQILAEASNVNDALQLIQTHSPQLLFLDIEMPNQTGFDLLRLLPSIHFKIIFVTAHSHYAIKAIRFSALDYLLKPIDTDDLIVAVEKAKKEIGIDHQQQNKSVLENLNTTNIPRITIPIKDGMVFFEPAQITRLEADGTYTHIFVNNEKFTATKNIKEYEDILAEHYFFRTHKSHLINLKQVKRFSREDGYFVFMNDGSKAEVSRRKQEEFLELMKTK